MNQRLEAVFGDLPKTLFYEFPTPGALATHLMAEYRAGCLAWSPAAARVSTERPETEPSHARSTGSTPIPVARPDPDTEPIAIIGLAGRFPGSDSLEEYWENLRTGEVVSRRSRPNAGR